MNRRDFIASLAATPVLAGGAVAEQAAGARPPAAARPLSITLLGTGTPAPSLERQSSGYLIEYGTDLIVWDHGPGAHHRLIESGHRTVDVTHAFFTHLPMLRPYGGFMNTAPSVCHDCDNPSCATSKKTLHFAFSMLAQQSQEESGWNVEKYRRVCFRNADSLHDVAHVGERSRNTAVSRDAAFAFHRRDAYAVHGGRYA